MMNVAAVISPSIPIASALIGTATANASGSSIFSGTSNNSTPHASVATSEYAPTTPLAIVIGASATANGTGAATSSSSVPSQRWFSSAPLEPSTTSAHIVITAAPSEADNSSSGSFFPSRR